MKTTRKIVEIDEELCNGCGECLPNCAEGAISIVDGKARLKADKLCDGLGACLGHCPMGALKIIERTAEEFDEEAAHREVAAMKAAEAKAMNASAGRMPCGCPGSNTMTLNRAPAAHSPQPSEPQASNLGHWPVKLRLVPADAPFLRGAEVVISADCAPVALPDFNRRLAGKVVMIACPKFDDTEAYLHKLVDMFRSSGIARVQVLRMEVPCCTGLATLVKQAAQMAGTGIPVEDLIVTRLGVAKPAEALNPLF